MPAWSEASVALPCRWIRGSCLFGPLLPPTLRTVSSPSGWDASAPKLRMEVLSSSAQKMNNTIAITDVEGTYSMPRQGSDTQQGSAMQGEAAQYV